MVIVMDIYPEEKPEMTGDPGTTQLVFEDPTYLTTTMGQLNALRKNRHFCDVILQVGPNDIPAHRALLACCSPYLFELFNSEVEGSNHLRYQIENASPAAVEKLVDFAYTSRLCVQGEHVCDLYSAAKLFRMESVRKTCSNYLATHLTPANSVGVRSFAYAVNDHELISVVDKYIRDNIMEVSVNKEFLLLPRLQVELIRKEADTPSSIGDLTLFNLVVEWAQKLVADSTEDVKDLMEQVHLMLLTPELQLIDCEEADQDLAGGDEVILDYQRRAVRKKSTTTPHKRREGQQNGHRSPRSPTSLRAARKLIMDTEDNCGWGLIAATQTSDHSYVCIAMLDGGLSAITLHERAQSRCVSRQTSMVEDIGGSMTLMEPMSHPRCGAGAVELNGKLIAAGGHNREECLDTVEAYDPSLNTWTPLHAMSTSRGRFEMAVLEGKLYAVGGSNGSEELTSAECYNPNTNEWKTVANSKFSRCSSGVAVQDGLLYVVGGQSGQCGLRSCEVYNPQTDTWNPISPLNTGRYQTGVCALDGSVFAVGGTDSWNCLSSAEAYSPDDGQWKTIAPLKTARRGAGVAAYKGKLYAVGGFDGVSSLDSVECYDPDTGKWTSVAGMNMPRSNVGVAVVDGHLFAVGGFDGQTFLNTIERYNDETNEWSCFTTTQD
ncbi:PREDICTED: influenza virus NS1A-binding protein homolog A-like [Branchiostoma belcheri]|uniref:Influenza virus NS1A-binding protein homolog A-like n=1 Tax=Branchiostoma belcheri TaxID=7741 RepID=A0A6P5ANJ7_BRABE|nr:PREDICTED: influenza virus NS1A-binding protein homolog A-like [Branchiostoma belcheri]